MTKPKTTKAWGIKYSNGRISRWAYPSKLIATKKHQDIFWAGHKIEVIQVQITEVKRRGGK